MSDVRCHACGAAVPSGAEWCTLCFADLRPPPVREPVTVPAATESAAVGAGRAVDTVEAAPSVAQPENLLAGTPLDTTKSLDAKEPGESKVSTVTWPCPRCDAQVPIESDTCTDCGAPFLSGATVQTNTELPLVGDIRRMSQGQRLVMGMGAAVVLMMIFFVLAEIITHVF